MHRHFEVCQVGQDLNIHANHVYKKKQSAVVCAVMSHKVLSKCNMGTSHLLQGILFSVRPPKKSWKNIANLSGGEKTLSSLSLVFALHHYKPTPLYVMDEIDAALGECATCNLTKTC